MNTSASKDRPILSRNLEPNDRPKKKWPYDSKAKNTPGSARVAGHDKDIQRLIKEAKKVTVKLMSGCAASGVIIESDKYSFKMVQEFGSKNGKRVEHHTYFKHAIEEFVETITPVVEFDEEEEGDFV